jgi:hypothetical protein
MGNLSNFERRLNNGVHLAGASVTKAATLLSILGVTISKVIHETWEDNIS